MTAMRSCGLLRAPMALLLATLLAGVDGDPRTAAWAAWNAAETVDREAIPLIRAYLDGAGTDPEGRRLTMVALDSLIRLNAPADRALIHRAEALGAHVQALILASRAGREGETWALEAAGRVGDQYERADQLALLDMVASQRSAAAAAVLWRDGTAVLTVVVRDPPDANDLGGLGMFGSRSGGGRKRAVAAGEPWPEAATYRLRQEGGEPLPALCYNFAWERTRDAGGGTRPSAESGQVRLILLAAMAREGLDRPVTAPDLQRKVTVEWQPGFAVATAVQTAQAQYHADWARFLAGLAAAGLAPASPAVQFLPLVLVDARRSGQDPLESVNGISWQLAPPRPVDAEELRQREAGERQAWEQTLRQMDANLERHLKSKAPTDTSPEP